MSEQGSIESELGLQLSLAIPGIAVTLGPITTPRAEGSGRVGSVRRTSSAGTRLEFAQTLWVESYVLTVFWSAATIPRETMLLEWEAFELAIQSQPGLSLVGIVNEVERAYLVSQTWGEAADGHFRTMSATVAVERVD